MNADAAVKDLSETRQSPTVHLLLLVAQLLMLRTNSILLGSHALTQCLGPFQISKGLLLVRGLHSSANH